VTDPNATPLSAREYADLLTDSASCIARLAGFKAVTASLDDLREMISANNLTAAERISAGQSIAALATLLRPRQTP